MSQFSNQQKCRTSACFNHAAHGSKLCADCKITRRSRSRKQAFYRTAGWQRLRRAQLTKRPLCAVCLSYGHERPATQIDHIVPIEDGGHQTSLDNLQSLCANHHSVKTREDVAIRRKRISTKIA